MSQTETPSNTPLLYALLAITVLSGLGNAAMTSSVSKRVEAVERAAPSAAAVPHIRPITGHLKTHARTPQPPDKLQTESAPKAKAKAKTKAKAKKAPSEGGGTKHAAMDAKIAEFAAKKGLTPAKTTQVIGQVRACYEALDRINNAAKSGKIDKTQRQKRMLSELKKRDDQLERLLGAPLAGQLKTDILTKG